MKVPIHQGLSSALELFPYADTRQAISKAEPDEMMGQILSAAGKAGIRPDSGEIRLLRVLAGHRHDSSRRFFLPVKALSHIFRKKFCEQLCELFQQDRLQFHGSLQQLSSPGAFGNFLWQLGQKDWVVYAKPPFGGIEQVLNYLARYTHRVVISNHRLVAFQNDRVSFRWRDYAHGGKNRVMTGSANELLCRFLLHVLPKGLVCIRHFGLFANRRRETALARCRELLGAVACADRPEPTNQPPCPACSGTMLVIERMTSAQLYSRFDLSLPTPRRCYVDSS